jgi:hypothetical protein
MIAVAFVVALVCLCAAIGFTAKWVADRAIQRQFDEMVRVRLKTVSKAADAAP